MGWRAATLSVVVLAALALGVVGAVGQSTTTTVRIQIIGKGTVKDGGSVMSCGNGATTCRISYSGSGTTVTFTATAADGWTFAGWSGDDCSGLTCDVDLDLDDED